MSRMKSTLKFFYAVAALCLLGAVLWFCFGSPYCYNSEEDTYGDSQTLGPSLILDIVALVILFLSVYCVK